MATKWERLSQSCRGALAHQAHEGFVDERRRLQGVSGPLAAQVGRREPVQLAVDDLRHLGRGRTDRPAASSAAGPSPGRAGVRPCFVRAAIIGREIDARRGLGGFCALPVRRRTCRPRPPTSSLRIRRRRCRGIAALDVAYDQLQDGDIAPGLDDLFETCAPAARTNPRRGRSTPATCLDHPLRDLLHQDPFTYRAFSKPRGYAGDAVMMDYIYGLGEARQAARQATPLGRAIFRYMEHASVGAGRPVSPRTDRGPDRPRGRARRRRACSRSPPVIFAKSSSRRAVQNGQRATSSSRSTRTRRAWRSSPATTRASASGRSDGSVRQILSGKVNPGQFDFVYAAGLFDYLSAPVAAALTRRMFEMTRPGGMMLIPNFLATRSRSRLHGVVHGLAADLPRPRRHARAGRRSSRRAAWRTAASSTMATTRSRSCWCRKRADGRDRARSSVTC